MRYTNDAVVGIRKCDHCAVGPQTNESEVGNCGDKSIHTLGHAITRLFEDGYVGTMGCPDHVSSPACATNSSEQLFSIGLDCSKVISHMRGKVQLIEWWQAEAMATRTGCWCETRLIRGNAKAISERPLSLMTRTPLIAFV